MVEHDGGTGLVKRSGDLGADALGCAGDEGDFAASAYKLRSMECLLPLALCLASCGPAQPRADLVFIQSAEPETIDPTIVSDQVSMRISSALFEGLCRVNAAGKPEPGMAERWDVSEDRKTYVFHLREGIHWTNGDPVTAQDFVASWTRALKPETGSDYTSLLHVIRGGKAFTEGETSDPVTLGFRAIDARTVEVVLENPTPYFIALAAFQTLAPVPMKTLEQHGTSWIKPANIVSNGPYILEDWRIDDRIRLKKNPDYWDAANVRMASVEVKPVQDANTALNFFHTGQCDLMMDKGMMPAVARARSSKSSRGFTPGRFSAPGSSASTRRSRPSPIRACDRPSRWPWTRSASSKTSRSSAKHPHGASRRPVQARLPTAARTRLRSTKARELMAAAGFQGRQRLSTRRVSATFRCRWSETSPSNCRPCGSRRSA
jgi:hypothetical protein